MIELIQAKELILLKVRIAKNTLFASHYSFFIFLFEFQYYICNGCHDLPMLCLDMSDIVIIVESVDYHCINITFVNLKQLVY